MNTHGVYLTRIRRIVESPVVNFRHDSLWRTEKINVLTGDADATRDFTQEATPSGQLGVAAPVHMCANKQHVFLLSQIRFDALQAGPEDLTWIRLDANLQTIDQGTYRGPWFDPLNSDVTTIDLRLGGFAFGRPVITPDGNVRHYNLVLDRDDLTLVLEHKPGPLTLGMNFFAHGSGVIAADVNTNLIYGQMVNLQTGFGNTGPWTDSGARGGLAETTRRPAPGAIELLSVDDGRGPSFITARSAFLTGLNNVIWILDLDPLLRDHVAQQERPAIPPGATLEVMNVRHSGDDQHIRVVGTLTEFTVGVKSNVDIFVAEIARGAGSGGIASVNWYLDSAHTPQGGVPIERPVLPAPGASSPEFGPGWSDVPLDVTAATGVMGSGVDYIYTPAN